jgi:hypothetical protein
MKLMMLHTLLLDLQISIQQLNVGYKTYLPELNFSQVLTGSV